MNLGDYIQIAYPLAEGQFITDMNQVGDFIADEISTLYVSRTIASPSWTGMKNSITYADTPVKDNSTLSYYIIQRFSLGFDAQQELALDFLEPSGNPPLPPGTIYVYPAPAVGTLMKAALIADVITVFGPTAVVTPQLNLLVDAFDAFLLEAYTVI